MTEKQPSEYKSLADAIRSITPDYHVPSLVTAVFGDSQNGYDKSFFDGDVPLEKLVVLVTPDGRQWVPRSHK